MVSVWDREYTMTFPIDLPNFVVFVGVKEACGQCMWWRVHNDHSHRFTWLCCIYRCEGSLWSAYGVGVHYDLSLRELPNFIVFVGVKVACGQRMGWGVHYDPSYRDLSDFDDKDEQLVLCYVTLDVTIIFAKLMLQPPGGWFPVVALHPYGKEILSNISKPKPKPNPNSYPNP